VSESSDELTGPDLEKGVEISSVGAGQMVAGHAFGEPVLLVHVEPNWFALGAKCTHYGAPLSEGALVGETIRCPWHHACFELRNRAGSERFAHVRRDAREQYRSRQWKARYGQSPRGHPPAALFESSRKSGS